jgi:hypothetical protein
MISFYRHYEIRISHACRHDAVEMQCRSLHSKYYTGRLCVCSLRNPCAMTAPQMSLMQQCCCPQNQRVFQAGAGADQIRVWGCRAPDIFENVETWQQHMLQPFTGGRSPRQASCRATRHGQHACAPVCSRQYYDQVDTAVSTSRRDALFMAAAVPLLQLVPAAPAHADALQLTVYRDGPDEFELAIPEGQPRV